MIASSDRGLDGLVPITKPLKGWKVCMRNCRVSGIAATNGGGEMMAVAISPIVSTWREVDSQEGWEEGQGVQTTHGGHLGSGHSAE